LITEKSIEGLAFSPLVELCLAAITGYDTSPDMSSSLPRAMTVRRASAFRCLGIEPSDFEWATVKPMHPNKPAACHE
jgi:hypothetical protein